MKSTFNRSAANRGSLSLAALALLASPLASAQDPYWYGGANIGRTETGMDDAQAVSRLLTAGYTTASIDADDDDYGFKLLAGYRFNRNFAIEGSAFDLGKFGFRQVLVPDANLAGNIRPMGYGLDLAGFLPMSDVNSLFARVGLNYAELRESFSARNLASHPFPKSSNNDFNLKFGVGFQHDFSDNLAMRIEAERYRLDETTGMMDDGRMYSLGVVYRFGAKPAARASAAAAPFAAAPVRAAPAPAPAAPPAPPAPVKVTLSADSMFAFDSSTVQPGGRAELDQLVADLRPLDYDSIMVTGHTDRIGSEAYNLQLSQRRAQAVKDYLVSSGGIAANRITARGIDGSQPVTSAGQCANLARAQLITCLQPDRRVEVEVVGTR